MACGVRARPAWQHQYQDQCPHAFANPTTAPARMLFLVTPPGHENYLEELAGLLTRGGPPDPDAAAPLGARYDIVQLTALG